jgi:plastocyanin
VRRSKIPAVVFAVGSVVVACQSGGPGEAADDPRVGYGGMGIHTPVSPRSASLLGPDTFPCQHPTGDEGYTRYGVGPMRRGGLEREKLEPDHIVIDGHGVNGHGTDRVLDGARIEMEMDEDYFAPTILKARAGATVTIELENEGIRQHNFSVPGQAIDLTCGVRGRDEVEIVFPRSGVLTFFCRFGAASGMRGAMIVERSERRGSGIG